MQEGGWVVCRVFKKRNLPVSSKATTTHDDNKAMKSSNSDNVIDTNTLSDAEETPLKRRPKKLRGVRHTREVDAKSDQDVDIISSENFPGRIKSETMSHENTLSSCPLIISTIPTDDNVAFEHCVSDTPTINEDNVNHHHGYHDYIERDCAIASSASMFDDGFQLPSLICSNDNNDDDE